MDGLQSFVGWSMTRRSRHSLALQPMAKGTYLPGDPITVALVLTRLWTGGIAASSSLTISTNVVTLSLCRWCGYECTLFYREVSSAVSLNSDTALKVNSISNLSSIKDMCNLSGTSQDLFGRQYQYQGGCYETGTDREGGYQWQSASS